MANFFGRHAETIGNAITRATYTITENISDAMTHMTTTSYSFSYLEEELRSLHRMPETEKIRLFKGIGSIIDTSFLTSREFDLLLKYLPRMTNLHNIIIGVRREYVSPEKITRLMAIMCNLRGLYRLGFVDQVKVQIIPDAIANLIKLRTFIVELADDPIVSENLYNLTNLQKLIIRGPIRELSHKISNLQNLTHLGLERAPYITALPESIGQLSTLSDLVLENLSLTELPEGITNNIYLHIIKIMRCPLISLPNSIGRLKTKLHNLELQELSLTNLPDSIGNCTFLRNLIIRHCPLTSLPNSIVNCKNLTQIEISHCPLTSLPENIGLLSNLRILDIQSTSLTNIPNSITNLRNIFRVILQNNRIPMEIINGDAFLPFFMRLTERYGERNIQVEGVQVERQAREPQRRAYEVHREFHKVNFVALIKILDPSEFPLANKQGINGETFYRWLVKNIGKLFKPDGITERLPNGRFTVIEPSSIELLNNLSAMRDKFIHLGLDRTSWGGYNTSRYVQAIIEYVDKQPVEFIKNYVKSYVKDNIGAYGEHYDNNSASQNTTTSSCTEGMRERILLNLRTGGLGFDNPEYQKIAKIIGGETVVNDNCDVERRGESSIPEQQDVDIPNNLLGSFVPACIREIKSQLLAEPNPDNRILMMTKCVLKKLEGIGRVVLPEGGIDSLENIDMYVPNSVRDYLNNENVREMYIDDDYLQGGRRRHKTRKMRNKKINRKSKKRCSNKKRRVTQKNKHKK